MSSPGALILLSAGQDSATCLAWALGRYERVDTIGFFYGQRHAIEMNRRGPVRDAVASIRPEWGPRLGGDLVVDISGYGVLAESALTSDRVIEMASNGLPSTFVPGRNLVFLAVAAAHAYRLGIDTLVAGMCETDYSGYPDCRRDTLDAMQTALTLGLGEAMRVETPLMYLNKAQTWALAHELGGDALADVILEESHTCYEGDRSHRHDWGYGCGACPACELRARGWAQWRKDQPG